VNGNQKIVEPLTGTSSFFAIRTGLNFVDTVGIRYEPPAAKGASARAAETPPIIFRASRLERPFFFVGEAPSNSVSNPVEGVLPQHFAKSEQERQALV
jgi:hypothetical protein